MADERVETTAESSGPCLDFSLRPEESHLRASDGRQVPFVRAILTVGNACASALTDLELRATLGQEGGTVQDVSSALAGAAAALTPGAALDLDVFDLLIPAHAGAASKIHMFGYRAVLNWVFELAVWGLCRRTGESGTQRSAVARWRLQWSAAGDGSVALKIEQQAG